MNNNFVLYNNLYELKDIKINVINKNTINFLLFDSELRFYTLCNNNIPSYSFNLNLGVIEIIKNMEQTYKIKVLNFFPICHVNGNSLLMACKVIVNDIKYLKLHNIDSYDEAIELTRSKVNYYLNEYDNESFIIEKYCHRYKFYNKFIKKFILTEGKRNKKEYLSLIKKICGNYSSIIDVSCGDNLDIARISNENTYVIFNDISLYQVRYCESKYQKALYTNDNVLALDFKNNAFDVSYCKNTLHHMRNDKEICKLLNNMYGISKKMVIVEIENPKNIGGMSEFLNKYLYNNYLKDRGNYFLSFYKFKKIIDNNFRKKSDISYLSFKNVLGNYMIAIIEKR